ncbi:MAG: M4 family metallopeptidase [Pseudomonadota bacterium]|nr:M4 family metallopeptidase [Pseudomonadota bacterium]
MNTGTSVSRIAVVVMMCVIPSAIYSATWEKVQSGNFDQPLRNVTTGIASTQTDIERVASALRLPLGEAVVGLSEGKDKNGNLHRRYQQTYQGLPIWGQHITVHEQGGAVYSAQGQVARNIDQDIAPALIAATFNPALFIPSSQDPFSQQVMLWLDQNTELPAAQWSLQDYSSTRQVYLHNQTAKLVRVITFLGRAHQVEPVRPTLIIDETTLQVLAAWNGLAHVEATGPGGNEKTGRYHYGTDHDFLDVRETADGCVLENENVYTVDLANGTNDNLSTPFAFECYENTARPANGAYSPLNDAHFFGNTVFGMYQDWFGLPPLRFKLALKVHYGQNYENAYWDGASMVFGDGDTVFYPLVDINVVSHEVSHGFTEQNSGLIYNGQSGGLNESFSDIAGEAAEYYLRGEVDWLVGADTTKRRTAMRYFEDPTLDGRSIGHADDYTTNMDVHLSSGVYNRAYFLLANTPGWNPRLAFELFVHANRFYWGPATDFDAGACGLILAAQDLGWPAVEVAAALRSTGVFCRDNILDTDEDGMPDNWEFQWGLDFLDPADASLDADNDGLKNRDEYRFGTSPRSEDTDNDTLTDYDELFVHGTSPSRADTDFDKMPDNYELAQQFNPKDPQDALLDADGDGFSNVEEFEFGSDPHDPASQVPVIEFMFESFESMPRERWTFTPDNDTWGWQTDNFWSTHGHWSLAAMDVPDASEARAMLSGFFDEGTLSFDFRVSTERVNDRLLVYVDGAAKLDASGTREDRLSIPLSRGYHRIEFVYYKFQVYTEGLDRVWIDSLLFMNANPDVDGDGMDSLWEIDNGLDPHDPADAILDDDADGLNNLEEFQAGTSIFLEDSDGDTLSDGDEVKLHRTSPILTDTDGDEIPDQHELGFGFDPTDPADGLLDSDGDDISNTYEYLAGSDPLNGNSVPPLVQFFEEDFEQTRSPLWKTHTQFEGEEWWYTPYWSTQGDYAFITSKKQNSGQSELRLLQYFDDGVMTFDYSVKTFGANRFEVYVDDVLTAVESGQHRGELSLQLTRGMHQIRFVLAKGNSSHEETEWLAVDRVRFITSITDVDGDGLPNLWEYEHGYDLLNGADGAFDLDNDGLTTLQEFQAGSDPANGDTDGDTLSDGDEVKLHQTSPINEDSDTDGMLDPYELEYGFDPNNGADGALDSDHDGLSNLEESRIGTHPHYAVSSANPLTTYFESFERSFPEWTLNQSAKGGRWATNTIYWQTDGKLSLLANSYYMDAGETLSAEITLYVVAGNFTLDYFTYLTTPGSEFYIQVDNEKVFSSESEAHGSLSVPLSAGVHTLKFKLYYGGSPIVRAYIDNLRFTPVDSGVDADTDGMADTWETRYLLNPANNLDASEDADDDGFTNLDEYLRNLNPLEGNVDLRLTLTDVYDNNSSEINYQVRVYNQSRVNATNLVINNAVNQPNFDVLLEEGSELQCDPANGTLLRCTLAELGATAYADFRIKVYTTEKTTFSSSVAATEVDHNPLNNEDTQQFAAGPMQWLTLLALSLLYSGRRRLRIDASSGKT